ncbi:MFS transporter [Gordonia sp. NPDC003424]
MTPTTTGDTVAPTAGVETARRVALAAFVGTAMEWYDFFLFTTAAALVFNAQFFVSDNALAATLASFATLAVGFIARPFGGLLFGWLGDKIGRRKVLLTTIVMIGVATVLIGLLPNYFSIGAIAPIALVTLRILQGLAVGGEWSGAVTLTTENTPPAHRAKFAAIPQLGSPVGTILSSGAFFVTSALVSEDNFKDWGWRIPFLLALPLLVFCVMLRRRLEESPAFLELQEEGEVASAPLKQVFVKHWRQILAGAAVGLLGVAGFYIVTTFIISYGKRVLGLSPTLLLAATFIAATFELAVIWTGGRLGQRFGSTAVSIWSGVGSAVLAVPVFWLIGTGNPLWVVIAMTIGVCALSYAYSVQGAIVTSLFPAKVRYSGVAVCSNLSGVVGGLVPLLATAVLTVTGDVLWPSALMLVVLAMITVGGAIWARRLCIPEAGLKH